MEAHTILVVDDEAHIRQVVSLKLQNAGFTIITARDAEEALEVASGSHVDLVLTDYQMPGPTGLELAQRLHGEAGKRDIPIILLTAHGLGIEAVELTRAGIACCISKPFSPREVLAKVNSLLNRADGKSNAPIMSLNHPG